MHQSTAIQRLAVLDQQGRYVFTSRDLGKLFPEDGERAFQASLQRLVKHGVLTRATKGIYVFTLSRHKGLHTLELIAKAMRRGEYNYVSLESALSEYGVISQIPIDRLTVMSTGRKGEYKTPFGVIEFTHTKRPVRDLLEHLHQVGRPLRLASKQVAYRDLKRVGRNTHLVDEEALNED
ncbi:hypothetical protein C7I36_16485 [Zobellella taiwanensis]|uniref:AbiEi antitoxin C-terminal domain-containing protein n=1 Tax=Zobellella taiwanensis TaxID=347535 RepID=A0A2P7QF48_9GAMM|nr:type IV toxin-antitoxin system AbiEi family antitoxin domain-containing protein [Zobellella taiwanensis]PSJ36608.1 hypothetical protein C7I36_16485 [Zobellella taiwanensis]